MSRMLEISDSLYERLEAAARQRGLDTVEQLLEAWQAADNDRERRTLAVQHANEIRAKLFARYGEMPDSTALIREDRGR